MSNTYYYICVIKIYSLSNGINIEIKCIICIGLFTPYGVCMCVYVCVCIT